MVLAASEQRTGSSDPNPRPSVAALGLFFCVQEACLAPYFILLLSHECPWGIQLNVLDPDG